MRNDAGWLSKLTFSYPKPLIDAAKANDISFDQYGNLPENHKIKHEVDTLERMINEYINTYPGDKNSIFNVVLKAKMHWFSVFFIVKIILSVIDDYFIPQFISEIIKYIEQDETSEE